MATSSSPTPATAQQIAQQRTAQRTAAENANAALQDPAFQAAKNNLVSQEQAKNEALARYRALPSNATPEQSAAAKNEYDAAYSTYTNTLRTVDAGVSQANSNLAQGVTYGVQQERTAGVQTTSPAPTFEQNQQEAEIAGQTAANQPAGNPPVIPSTVPVPPPYNPTLNTPVNQDEVFNQLRQNFQEQGFAEPQAPFVFTQSQIDYIESYNNRLAETGNQGLQVAANSPEALDVLIERGEILPDDDGFPVEQKEISAGEFVGEGATQDGGFAVNIRGVLGDPAIDSQVVETFEEGDPAVDSEFTEEFPAANRGVQSLVNTAREQSVGKAAPDWRVRIKLADAADYFYNSDQPGIMAPLRSTNGVIFPYTPQISVTYAASYTPLDVIHTNYKFYSYKNSSVENLMITADFTAQNTVEANYLLAVIHFFRSATKMFYGQDQNPSRGVPPPLMYLSGYGPYQFDNHPVVITNFTYNLPVDVDYISAYPTNNSNALGGVNLAPYMPTAARSYSPLDRLRSLVSSGIAKGGLPPPPNFQNSQNINESTRVPTKINIQLSCLPITTRNAVSNKFSLKNYANGSLLRGSVNPGTGGGFW